MALQLIGDSPLTVNSQGGYTVRIGTIFLGRHALVTLPGIHATQRMAFTDGVNRQRKTAGQPPLTRQEEREEWEDSVDLIMEDGFILIRPDPVHMDRAFAADELLQELVSKRNIRFLNAGNESVRQAIKERGECWRISPLPRSPAEMIRMIAGARISIAQETVYYYNMVTGTRFLTFHAFSRLETLAPEALARQLAEIRDYSGRRNRLHNPEVDFFLSGGRFGHKDFAGKDFPAMPPETLRTTYQALNAKFRKAVPPECREDNPENLEWRNAMFSHLVGQRKETLSEEVLHGLSPEFFMQIEWLPGGRFEGGELVFDPIFDELEQHPQDAVLRDLCDEKAKGFIFNFIRDFGDLEYVNIGRVAGSLSRRPQPGGGRRGGYNAEIKHRESDRPAIRIIRLQKWGIAEHLEEGKDLLRSIMESEEYTQYVLDRRLGCRQLGMSLPTRITTRKVYEKYYGPRREYVGQLVWTTYYEREYVPGVASDKIPRARYENPAYALKLAMLLGRAAAPNLIVGRTSYDHTQVYFDDGDEVVAENASGLPETIVLADQTGTFADYETPLARYARQYARPVQLRAPWVPSPVEFAEAYLAAFTGRFLQIQAEYRRRKRAFDTLFKHRQRDEAGSFAYRWERVLARLDSTDAAELTLQLRTELAL